ncbi:hypothetical protein KAT80_02250 [Candidatus Pacearchaeota archaeon]|nr:hypothetical protein [Candidatus Pacearchaeota archaeon]
MCSHNGKLYDSTGNVIRETETGKVIDGSGWFVNNLCSCNGKMYHTEGGKIYETINRKQVTSRENNIEALCSHKGQLYDVSQRSVYETFTGKKITSTNNWIFSLCSHDYLKEGQSIEDLNKNLTKIYQAITRHGDYEIEEGGLNLSRQIRDICSHKGILYDVSAYGLLETLTGKEIISGKNHQDLRAICSHPKKELLKYWDKKIKFN